MANLNKYHSGFLPLIILVFLFFMANSVSAQTKVFVEEYTYQASEADSKLSSRVIALEQVKRLLLEKLGTYLESETEVKNFQLTKDQIVILTAGIVASEIIDEKWDGKTYYLKAKIAAEPKVLASSINKLRQDRQKTRELEETRKRADAALREIERLKKELEISKAEKISDTRIYDQIAKPKGDPNTKLGQYNEAINRLSATDWAWVGYALVAAGGYQEAVEALTRAIKLDPKAAGEYSNRGAAYEKLGNYWPAIKDYDQAISLDPIGPSTFAFYTNRGVAYSKLGNYQQAIKDYDRAIELNPSWAEAYNNRGVGYVGLGDYPKAIRDYNRAIELDPKYSMAYRNRGYIYAWKLGNHRQAIRDYDRAIELDPKYADAYINRGSAYNHLGDWRKAIRDYDKGIEVDPNDAAAYTNRGAVYDHLGDYRKAIRDYDKAIELDPNFAGAYSNRGGAYHALGDYGQAIRDYKTAARLGRRETQDFLRSQGISW